MKLTTTGLIAIVTAAVVIGMVTVGIQQVYAPRSCAGCAQFKKLTHEFEKGVITALEDPENIPDALNAYSQDVQGIFRGDPNIDQVRTLLQGYERDVTTLFDSQPPDPDKQLIKEFKQLTKAFEQGSINQLTAASIHP